MNGGIYMGFEIITANVYTKGDLKGYIDGIIEFSNGKVHEFLYRIHDPENGDSNKLVSIDYGFENPMVDELWDTIEKYIYDTYCRELKMEVFI